MATNLAYGDIPWQQSSGSGAPPSYYDTAAKKLYMQIPGKAVYEGNFGDSGSGLPAYYEPSGQYWVVDGWENGGAKSLQGKSYNTYNNDGSLVKSGTVNWAGNDPLKDAIMNFALVAGAGLAAGGIAGAGAGGTGAAGAGSTGAATAAGDAFLPGALGAGGSEVAMGSLIPGLESYALAGPGMAGWGMDLGMEGLAGATPTSGMGATLTGTAGGALTAAAGTGGSGWLSSLTSAIPSGASSLLGPAATLGGAVYGAGAAKDAANAQIESVRESNALLKAMFDKQIELQEPFRQGGIAGLNKLTFGLGLAGDPNAAGYGALAKDFSMADYEADPGYAFRQSEGQKALERSAAARGGLLSGRAAKDMTRFAQGEASQEYGNAFNRFQINRAAKINPLQSLMGAGQSSANTLTQAAGNYGQQAGQNTIGAGNAAAAGKVGSANAITNGISSAWNGYSNNQLMNRLFPSGV
jgi:hypothetical protein